MPYRNGKRKTWLVTLPTGNGLRKRISTGTTHEPTAKRFERMILDLGPKGKRDSLLDRVADGSLSIGTLYDYWNAENLPALRTSLADVDIEPFIELFLKRHSDHVSPSTIENYRHKLRLLMPEGEPFPCSLFTVSTLDSFITNYDGRRPIKQKAGSPSSERKAIMSPTKRKAHAALSQFAAHLVRHKILPHNPLRDLKAPPSNRPRIQYLEIVELRKLVEAQDEPFRSFAALLAGTGIDVSSAFPLRRKDLDIETKRFRAPGTKNHNRDRVVTVAEWAWQIMEADILLLGPSDLLFPAMTVERARKSHETACELLGIENYTQRDHRHTYAVRALRAGTPAEIVARQLGHCNTAMVTQVYGRFVPDGEEVAKWEKIATANDAKAIEAAKKVEDAAQVATTLATKPVLTLIHGNAKRRANPKGRTALRITAGGLEPPTVALTVRCSAN